jgi:glycosyltransferase involved in cell wall biosynthesis
MSVLRLASVFEIDSLALGAGASRFDPIGGMQTHTGALTRAMDAEGVAQTVLTSRLSGPRGSERIGRHSGVVRLGVRTARWRQLWAVSALPRVLRRGQRIDLVHVHQGEDIAALPLGALAAKWNRCPLVVTVHCSVSHTMAADTPRAWAVRALGSWAERQVLPRADVVIVLAERTAALLSANGIPSDRVRVLPSGFEPAVFAGVAETAAPARIRPRVGYIGRMAAQKRPELVVRAFGCMAQDSDLLMVGDGPHRAAVEREAALTPVRDSIVFTGFVEHAGIPAVLAGIDVLVLPSGYEELGSVLVEAMAAGVPVVATRVGGIPEVVLDGETGLLVPPGDHVELARAIDQLLGDRSMRERMSRCARDRAKDYGWPSLARRTKDIYRSVLREGSDPR